MGLYEDLWREPWSREADEATALEFLLEVKPELATPAMARDFHLTEWLYQLAHDDEAALLRWVERAKTR